MALNEYKIQNQLRNRDRLQIRKRNDHDDF